MENEFQKFGVTIEQVKEHLGAFYRVMMLVTYQGGLVMAIFFCFDLILILSWTPFFEEHPLTFHAIVLNNGV